MSRLGLDPDGVGIDAVVPQFFGDATQPDALAALRTWTAALPTDLDQQDAAITAGRTKSLAVPVTVMTGSLDRYLTPALATEVSAHFRTARIVIVDGASHWPQWDDPSTVAAELLRIAP